MKQKIIQLICLCFSMLLLILFTMIKSCVAESITAHEVPQYTFPDSNAEPVPYVADLEVNTLVYADIVEINPVYTISLKMNGQITDPVYQLVCSAVTAEGETIWVFFDRSAYVESIDPDSSFYYDHYLVYDMLYDEPYDTMKVFDEPLRIRGSIRRAEAMHEGLSDVIGQSRIFEFRRVVSSENADKE